MKSRVLMMMSVLFVLTFDGCTKQAQPEYPAMKSIRVPKSGKQVRVIVYRGDENGTALPKN